MVLNKKKPVGTLLTAAFITAAMFAILSLIEDTPYTQVSVRDGPEVEFDWFSSWHHPEPALLNTEELRKIWDRIDQTQPSQGKETGSSGSRWICIGPWGQNMTEAPYTRYSGRVLDLELNEKVGLRVASASGGLFEFDRGFPKPLTDDLWSLACGTFASKPGDPDIIILGTGEPVVRSGLGVYRTTDGGSTWHRSAMEDDVIPTGFYKIRFQPQTPDRVHLACVEGYYISEDGGVSFRRTLEGNVSDFDFAGYFGHIWAAVWGSGFYKSTDYGETWEQIHIDIVLNDYVGRTDVSAYDDQIICYNIANRHNHRTLAVIKTENGGVSWKDISPGGDLHWGQGHYNNAVSICPVDPDIMFVGGGTLYRSHNGGADWSEMICDDYPDLHADFHRIVWSADGSKVYAANDGGFSVSMDQGLTWDTWGNILPITQYVGIDVHGSGVIAGGSQDNGISVTTDGGIIWHHVHGGDGGRTAIQPGHPENMFITAGVYGGWWKFRRKRSSDYGMTWEDINTGVNATGQWNNAIRFDPANPERLYHHAGPWAYYSDDRGSNWKKLHTEAFPVTYTLDLSVMNGIVYVCLEDRSSDDHSGRQLRVYENGCWFERSDGLPNHLHVWTVVPHPRNDQEAYALMTGLSDGEKIYHTTNRGRNWNNISGNLPNVIMGDLVVHPSDDNILYLGTAMGCYRTRSRGLLWHRWNEGMPKAAIVMDFVGVDSLSTKGQYFIVAATWGRSIWQREITAEDPVTPVYDEDSSLPGSFLLLQNHPNPFNSQTTITYHLPRPSAVSIKIYTILGEEVEALKNIPQSAGVHTLSWDAGRLPGGVYLMRFSTAEYHQVKKMLVLK